MPVKDAGMKLTEKDLARLENKIGRIYEGARKDIQSTINDYVLGFLERDEQMQARLDAGEITSEYYKQWRLNQIGRGERMKSMRDELSKRIYKANEVANAYINDSVPNIYCTNWNYSAYTIDKIHKGAPLNVYDENTIKRLITKNPKVMPNYPEAKAIAKGYDLAYSGKVISNTITKSILTGAPLKKMAEELQDKIIGMSLTSALRSARTSYTSAQNGGRLDCMRSASENGIDVQKQWLSGYDNRVRESHLEANAQIKSIDEPFEVGDEELMFPADPDGKPSEVYNCRCTLIYVVDGMSALDPQFNTGTAEDFKNWVKEKGKEPEPIPMPSKYNLKTKADAYNLLGDIGFNAVDKSLNKIQKDLLISNTIRLADIEKRFGIIKKSFGSVMSEASGNAIAFARRQIVHPSKQSLSMCSKYYKNKADHIELTKNAVLGGWSMPCKPEYYEVYSITHEYGHMIQNYFKEEAFRENGWNPNDPMSKVDKTKKSREAMFKWYYNIDRATSKKHYDEIIEIAKKNNPYFNLDDNISRYGKTNHEEFFAEVFANSQCGKPNELGRAMQEWLKQKGF